jgi:hypothetical protein
MTTCSCGDAGPGHGDDILGPAFPDVGDNPLDIQAVQHRGVQLVRVRPAGVQVQGQGDS